MRWMIGALLLLGCLSGCNRGASSEHWRIQLPSEPVTLDPALAEDGASLRVLVNTMEGLVGYDGAGKLQHFLAESHSVSRDGRRWEFVLRSGAKWSDGRPVTVADFVGGLKRALSPTSGSKLAGMLFTIRGARAYHERKGSLDAVAVRDEGRKLVIELETPAPYFLQALTLPVALPQRQDVLDANGGVWPEDAPSTGPYRMVKHQIERSMRFEKNPHYWNAASMAEARDFEFMIVSDESTAYNLFEQGKLDVLSKFPPSETRRIASRGLLRVEPFLATYFLSFNLSKPPFNDREWRRAVAGAVRREEIVAALDTGDVPARGWIPRGLEGYVPYSDPTSVFLPSISAVRKRGGSREKVVAMFDTSARNSLIMEKVQQDLNGVLGLKIALNNQDWKSYAKLLRSDPPQMFRWGMLAPFMDPILLLTMFKTGDPMNFAHWSNAEYDRLVDRIALLPAGARREALIREASEMLVEREAVVVPIYHYVQTYAVAQRVGGFRATPFGNTRVDELRMAKP